jgi:hypothetical protein
MTRLIELPDEIYERLKNTAATGGITPAEWIARYLAAFGDDKEPCPNTTPARMIEEKPGALQPETVGTGTAMPRNMAERLAGRLGRFSGSGGQPSSDNVAQAFAEHLEAKQRAGRL